MIYQDPASHFLYVLDIVKPEQMLKALTRNIHDHSLRFTQLSRFLQKCPKPLAVRSLKCSDKNYVLDLNHLRAIAEKSAHSTFAYDSALTGMNNFFGTLSNAPLLNRSRHKKNQHLFCVEFLVHVYHELGIFNISDNGKQPEEYMTQDFQEKSERLPWSSTKFSFGPENFIKKCKTTSPKERSSQLD